MSAIPSRRALRLLHMRQQGRQGTGMMAFSGPILRRFPASWLLVAAFLGGALRWLLIALVPDVTALFLLQPLHALSFALFWVTSLDLVKKRAPKEVLATAQGVFNAAVGAGAVAVELGVELGGGPYL